MKAVIFDMAGVIIDEGAIIRFSILPLVKKHADYKLLLKRYELAKTGKINGKEFGKGIPQWEKIEEKFLDKMKAASGIKILKKLRKKYKLGLLSNFVGSWADFLIKKHKLRDYFDSIVISANCRMKKPDKNIYLHVLKKLSAKANETWFVDDQKRNLIAAKKLGMKTVFFKTKRDRWFNEGIKFKADFNVKSLTELERCLMKEMKSCKK